jgi:hypothetical protein
MINPYEPPSFPEEPTLQSDSRKGWRTDRKWWMRFRTYLFCFPLLFLIFISSFAGLKQATDARGVVNFLLWCHILPVGILIALAQGCKYLFPFHKYQVAIWLSLTQIVIWLFFWLYAAAWSYIAFYSG